MVVLWENHPVEAFICERCEEEQRYKEHFHNNYWQEFWEDWGDIIKVFGTAIAVIAVGILLIAGLGTWYSFSICNSYIDVGIPARWTGFWTECMAEHPKFGWVPVDKYFEILNLYVP